MIEPENIIKINNSTQEEASLITPSKVEAVLTEETVNRMIDQAKSEIRNETKEIEKQVLLERASLITVFGLFASITSFLVIEFQCLKTVSSIWGILGFSCIVFALLLGFNIGLDYLIKSRFDKEGLKLHWNYIAFISAFFVIGCGAIFYGDERVRTCKYSSIHEML